MSKDRGGPSAQRPRVSQTRRQQRLEQERRAAQQRRLAAIIGGAVVVIAVIVAAALVVYSKTGGSAAAPTATPAPTATAGSAATAPKAPTAALTASSPSAAEASASKTACAPFLKAGNQPQGAKKWGTPPKQVINPNKQYQVKLYTDTGVITAQILPGLAPVTANNFIFLSCNGFYDGVIFHRVMPNFMIQGGDPLGTGTGGPGYQFNDEPVARPYQVGDLAMANAGANTNGSQFFIIQGSEGAGLAQSYNLFGHVIAGQNVVDAIANAPTHQSAGGEQSAPNTPVHIRTITVQVS